MDIVSGSNGGMPTPRDNKPSVVTKIFGFCLCFSGLALIALFAVMELRVPAPAYYVPAPVTPEAEPEIIDEPESPFYYPVGVLITETPERLDYIDGDMWINIPKLDLSFPVYAGVEDEDLNKGVGLFDEAQLPRSLDINSNTCIAGHRDVHGMEFYYIDRVVEGDVIYLTWNGNLFTYVVEDQFITHKRDWSAIETKEYPSIALQSCHPINIASERIFVVGRMVEVTENATFPQADEESAAAADQPVAFA